MHLRKHNHSHGIVTIEEAMKAKVGECIEREPHGVAQRMLAGTIGRLLQELYNSKAMSSASVLRVLENYDHVGDIPK